MGIVRGRLRKKCSRGDLVRAVIKKANLPHSHKTEHYLNRIQLVALLDYIDKSEITISELRAIGSGVQDEQK